jgi:hypothetical protein
MEKKELLDTIEAIIAEYPETTAQFEQVINNHKNLLRRQRLGATDNKIIVFLLKKEVVPTAAKGAKEKMAVTLKKMCETPDGCSCNLPHLKGLHVMTISNHFRTLCKKGLVEKLWKGHYKLAPNGWQFLERANGLQDAYNGVYDLL